MSEITTIQIELKTRERLKRFKQLKMETYDEMLNRIMDKLESINFYNPKMWEE